MSNARNLAKVAVDANGDIGTASLDNIDLTTRVAKAGDTMSGELTFTKDVGNHITFQNANQTKFYGRVMVSDNNDAYGSGERIFFGDGNNDVVVGTGNSSGTPVNSFIALRHSGEVSIGAGGSAKHLVIDTAGRVTMPYQPGFHAYNGSTTPADPIVWSNTYFNDVSIYNTSTGRMTVPTGANGKWLITFHTGFLNPAGVAFFIKKNGVTWVGYDMGTGSGWWQHAGTVIISLVAGDYITTAWSGSAASFDNGVWSSFQGQFLG